jgi:transcriptional regulator with XRE-family HTH domain
MTLAENLIHYSRRKGLTIAALAKMSGVKQPTLHGWTTGRSVKKIDDLKKVCNVLEIGLHTLLYGIKDPFEQDTTTSLLQEILKANLRITIERIDR